MKGVRKEADHLVSLIARSRYPLTANGRLHHSVISAITLSVIRLMVSLETVAP